MASNSSKYERIACFIRQISLHLSVYLYVSFSPPSAAFYLCKLRFDFAAATFTTIRRECRLLRNPVSRLPVFQKAL